MYPAHVEKVNILMRAKGGSSSTDIGANNNVSHGLDTRQHTLEQCLSMSNHSASHPTLSPDFALDPTSPDFLSLSESGMTAAPSSHAFFCSRIHSGI